METTRPMTKGSVCVEQSLREKLTSQITFKTALNLGSGGDYIEGWTNLDLDPNMNPDVIHNIDDQNLQLPFEDNSFDLVYCCNIMEHVWYLPQLKNEILRILNPGGALVVVVPHYLSLDAWGDDTHVRAFSEHSWYVNYWPGYKIKYQHLNVDATDSQGRNLQWMAMLLNKPNVGEKPSEAKLLDQKP